MRSIRLVLLLLAAAPLSAAELLPSNKPTAEAIDHYIDAKLAKSGVAPSSQVDDHTLVRRLTLDLVGRIPTVGETNAFVESKDSKKRELLVDRLMASPAFVRHQAVQFETMLAGPEARGGLRAYLTKALGENRPWDRVFRELLLPDDADAQTKGAGDFLKSRIADLDRVTNDVSVAFFGVNVSCAQCHDHPLVNDWTQDHFYGMKAFFSRTFDNGGFLAERETGQVKYTPIKGKEKLAPMMFLTGTTMDAGKEPTKDEEKKEREKFEQFKKDKKAPPAPANSARAKLVEVALRSKESEYFTRSIANRLVHRFLGYGLVMPLDQMHSENKASHPELLSWLARGVSDAKYDLRPTIRGIVLSKSYSRSTVWAGDAPPAPSLFAVGRLKPLTPTQMGTSLRLATYDAKTLDTMKPADFEKRIEQLEGAGRSFEKSFAPPSDDLQIGVNEALLFSNNDRIVKDLLADGNDRLVSKALAEPDAAKAVDLIVRTVLCRPSTADERKALSEYLGKRGERKPEAYRQVVWALLSGAEFRFNH